MNINGVILESCVLKIEKDIQKSTLCLVLSLYFKVRSHSFAKDIVDKHKVIKNNNWRTIQKKITCKYNITKKETIMKTNMKIIKRIMCKYDTFQLKEKEKSFEY